MDGLKKRVGKEGWRIDFVHGEHIQAASLRIKPENAFERGFIIVSEQDGLQISEMFMYLKTPQIAGTSVKL